jgi:hypothetical protein
VAQLFESRMITPLPARPTSTQFLPGLQRLDLNQVRLSVAMAAPPNDAVDSWNNPAAGIFQQATLSRD